MRRASLPSRHLEGGVNRQNCNLDSRANTTEVSTELNKLVGKKKREEGGIGAGQREKDESKLSQ